MTEIEKSDIEELKNYEFWTDGHDIRVGYDVTNKDSCLELRFSELEDLKSELYVNEVPSSVKLNFDKYIIYEHMRTFRVVKAGGEEVMKFDVEGLYPLDKVEESAVEKRRDYDVEETVRSFFDSRPSFSSFDILDIENISNTVCEVRVTRGNDIADMSLINKLKNEKSIVNRSLVIKYDEDVSAIVYLFQVNANNVIEEG